MTRTHALLFSALWCVAPAVRADDYRADVVDGRPAGVDQEIVNVLPTRHLRVRDGDAELCAIWVAKSWQTAVVPKPAEEVAPRFYRLKPGSLVGVLHLARTVSDVRDQEIIKGTYTLRYAVQPDLDAHRGTHDSRDFLVLLSTADDKHPDPIADQEKLLSLSARVTATPHPAIIPLVKPDKTDRTQLVRPDDRDPNGRLLLLTGHDERGVKIPLEIILLRAVSVARP